MSREIASQYVMTHEERERKRLALQGSILHPIGVEFFRRAGISKGMRVLDLGCGVGDISLILAGSVGRHGHVTSIDIDPGALATAARRVQEAGHSNVTFLQTALQDYRPEQPFDAVAGRHILIHMPDPLEALRAVREMLRPGGLAAFQEFDFATNQPSSPVMPLRDRTMQVFRDFFGRLDRGDIGTRLYHLFIAAGFPAPDGRMEYPMDGGADSAFYEWAAEAVKSIWPRAQALGIVKPGDLDLDTLTERLREEAVACGGAFLSPAMASVSARRP